VLLNRGARIEAAANDGWTALMVAGQNGHEKVVQVLLDRGARIEAADNDGWTALMVAAANGHEKVVQALLDRGARVEAAANSGETALMLAASKGRDKVVQVLKKHRPRGDPTILYGALCDVMSGTRDLTLEDLQELLVRQNMTDVRALYCAHNLILVSMRAGIIPSKDPWRAFDNSNPSFFIQLYHKVYDNLPTEDAKQFAIKIAHHAQIKGFLPNAFDIEQSIVLNEKMESKVTTVAAVIADLYERINGVEARLTNRIYGVEARVANLECNARNVTLALRQVKAAFDGVGARMTNLESNAHNTTQALRQVKANIEHQKKMRRVGAVARVVCSVIPFAAGVAAEAIAGGAELIFGTVEEIAVSATEFLVDKSIDALTSVDISDVRLAQFIVSKEFQSSLPPAAREAFACSVESEFGDVAVLQGQLIDLIEEQDEKPLALATRGTNVGRPDIDPAPTSAMTEAEWEKKFEKASSRFNANELTFSQAAKIIVGVSKRLDQYATCMEMFKTVDMDGNGLVDLDEFLLVVHQLGLH